MLQRFASLALCAAFLAPAPALAAGPDPIVKQAQTFLVALGYKIGTPDGVTGKKTEAAMADALGKYGQAYDGAIGPEDVALLAGAAPAKLKVDFGIEISEPYFLDAADINGDGPLDFAVTAMSDPMAQLGIPCCDVPFSEVKNVKPVAPILIYSTADGYRTTAFPAETGGLRTMTGRFFNAGGKTYMLLGRNGEMGMPVDNRGEPSIIVRIDAAAGEPVFTPVFTYPVAATTANVEVADLDADGDPELLVNNYNMIIGMGIFPGMSTLLEFGADEIPVPTKYVPTIEAKKPINNVRLQDIDSNGELDLLIAAEVQKSLDGKHLESAYVGSYVILNPWSRSTGAKDRIYLDPPFFGDDHAGYSMTSIEADGRVFLFEGSNHFAGHAAGGFTNYHLDAYEFLPTEKKIVLATRTILPKVPAERSGAGLARAERLDLDFDGVDELYLSQYRDTPKYMDWDGKKFALKSFPSKDFFKPSWGAILAYLADPALKCTRMVTFPENVGKGGTGMDIRISTCLPAASLN